jgi:hypothetical protein
MRTNLVAMLDDVGLHRALELPSSAGLFADRHELVSTTSAICHAVFVDGRNYSGAPRVDQHPLLRAFARQVLDANLTMTPDALVIPLGRATSRAMALTGVDPRRVFSDFRIPQGPMATESTSTSERVRQWARPWPPGLADRGCVRGSPGSIAATATSSVSRPG